MSNPLKWIKEEQDAVLESRYGDMDTKAARALLANIQITRVLLLVSSFGLVRWSYSSLNWQTVVEDMDLAGKIGLLIALVIAAWVMSSVAEYFVRYTVYITGFTISLKPGSMIRQYVYNTRVKFSMGMIALFLILLYLAVFYWGLSSLFGFFIPDATINWNNWAVGIVALIAVAGLVLFPASGVEPQNYQDLVKVLYLFEVVGIIRARDKLRQEVVKITTDFLPSIVAQQLLDQGPAAIDAWMQVPTDQLTDVAHLLGVGKTQVNTIRVLPSGADNIYGIKTKDGNVRVASLPATTVTDTTT